MDISNRKEYNLKIVEQLKEYFEHHPSMRFQQALWGLGIIEGKLVTEGPNQTMRVQDKFYEESEITFSKLETI